MDTLETGSTVDLSEREVDSAIQNQDDQVDSQALPPEVDFEWSSPEKETLEPPEESVYPLPNFSRTDINPFSSTYSTEISPQGYLGNVTGWYFIKAT